MVFRLVCLLLAATLVQSAPPRAPPDVHATLSLRDGKTTFRAGEPIRLILSFTADRPGYAVDTTTTNPASPIDDVAVSPETGVFPWLDIYSAPNRYSPDYGSIEKLSAKPTDVVLALNHWVRFDLPGEYTVRVTTKRLRTGETPFDIGRGQSLETNTVSFRIERMSEPEEEREVQRIGALLDATPKNDLTAQTEYCEDLAFLAGEAGAREKVRRYFLPDGHMSGNWQRDLSMGFFISRSPQIILGRLEDRLNDLGVPASSPVLGLAVQMRLWEELPPLIAQAAGDKTLLGRLKKERGAAIEQDYVQRTVDSLRLRVGESRRLTAEALVSPGRVSVPALAIKVLKDEFDQLSLDEQTWLVQARWKELRDPALVPALKRLASSPQTSSRTAFLNALLDVASDELRPLFVAAMLDGKYISDFDALRRLPQATLPELDAPLLGQLQQLAASRTPGDSSTRLELKSALAARYATGAIQSGVLEILDKFGPQLATEPKANLLAYLSKWNEAAARPLVEEAVATSQDPNWFLYTFTESSYPVWINQMMRERLESDDPRTASEAASRMSQKGPAEDLAFLQARLNRWLTDWSGRTAELEPADKSYSPQANLQVTLIRAIVNDRSWKLTDAQVAALMQTCLTDVCRRAFAAR